MCYTKEVGTIVLIKICCKNSLVVTNTIYCDERGKVSIGK